MNISGKTIYAKKKKKKKKEKENWVKQQKKGALI